MKKIKATDILFIGLAFFATYFGAGNMIFPPMLGLQSGMNWKYGMIGMLASGVGLPIITIIILGFYGSVQSITDHVHKKFYTFFIGMDMLICCFISIPRTAAVAIEMGLQGVWNDAPYFISITVYFLIALLFAKDRSSALDKVGKILTPVMAVILLLLVIRGIISPIGIPSEPSVDSAFFHSFLGGYNTGDVLASFLMASVFFNTIRGKGYEGAYLKAVNLGASLVAAVCLCIIYGGLLYMGACVSGDFSPNIGNAELLLSIIWHSGGQVAVYGLCLSVVLACLTTAIGMITATADFIDSEFHSNLSYKVIAVIITAIAVIVASFGLDTIVSLTGPWFSFIYPIALTLMLLGLFEKFIPNDGGFKGAVYFTIVYACLSLPAEYGIHINLLDKFLSSIPLYSYGFGWVVPAFVGFIFGSIIYPFLSKEQ